VVRQFDAEPFVGEIADPDGGDLRRIAITGADILAGFQQALYDDDLIPLLPSLTASLLRGDTAIIPVLAAEAIPTLTEGADAMAQSVECADRGERRELDPADVVAGRPELSTMLLGAPGATACEAWDVPAVEGFEEPVESDVPALVLAGEYDPVTPPDHGRRAAATLSRSTFVELPSVGHGAVFSHGCAESLFRAFVADPAAPLDTACVDGIGPPAWAVP
jgi:pimeloyl-ACP methyl ester carboxylesterase